MTKRVLLVDDEDDIREVASVSLSLLGGYTVTTVGSGAEAVEAAAADPPDAIVLDVMMPGMDGPATLLALRAQPSTAAVPIVFLTAKVQATDRERLEGLGAAGVVTKPFDPTTLSAEIAAVLGWVD